MDALASPYQMLDEPIRIFRFSLNTLKSRKWPCWTAQMFVIEFFGVLSGSCDGFVRLLYFCESPNFNKNLSQREWEYKVEQSYVLVLFGICHLR